MKGSAALLVAVVLLVAGVAAPAAGSPLDALGTPDRAAQVGATGNGTSTGSAQPPAPGALLAGVVGVHKAEIDGELAGRSFGHQVARASSNSSKASIVADRIAELDRQTAEHEERRRELVEARRNGTISRAHFQAEMAELAARNGAVQRQLDRTETTARAIPADLLETKGVNATAIGTIRAESRALADAGVDDVAGPIAGPSAGSGLASNESAGPPEDPPGQSGSPETGPSDGPPSDPPGQSEDFPGGSGSASTESSGEPTPRGSGKPADPGQSNRPTASTGDPGSPPDDPGGNRGNVSRSDQASGFPWGWSP